MKRENRKLKQISDLKQVGGLQSTGFTSIVPRGSFIKTGDDREISQKKDLLSKMLKINKLLERYLLIKKSDQNDHQFRQKLKTKIPQFESAIKNLKTMKLGLKFDKQDQNLNSAENQEFSVTLNSITGEKQCYSRPGDKEPVKNPEFSESFSKSVKSLLYSIKTDNLSRISNKGFIKELKQNVIASDEKVFEERIETLECLLGQLKD